jgi:nucleotidyltransferase substrate binding protein (TIGR01987 family)
MSQLRFIERQKSARESSSRLFEAIELEKTDIVRDAVIQRFEFTFESVWKAMQLYLEHQGHECPGSRTVIRKAFSERLIESEEEADLWFQMIEDRNLTTHAYDEELSDRIYNHILSQHARLLCGMAEKVQKLKWDGI